MMSNSLKLGACIGVLGVAMLARATNAMTVEECTRLPGNMYLAAVERGACSIDDIETAAGKNATLIVRDDGDRGGRNDGSQSSSSGKTGGRTGGYSGANGPNKP
jgi:hypothetical protein